MKLEYVHLKYTKYLISEQRNGIPMDWNQEWIFEVWLGMSNDQWLQIEPMGGQIKQCIFPKYFYWNYEMYLSEL